MWRIPAAKSQMLVGETVAFTPWRGHISQHSREMAALWRSFQDDVDVYDAAMQCMVDEEVSFRE